MAQPIKGDDLHRDFTRAVRALLAEQVITLLDRSNYQFASPDALDLDPRQPVFTPLEEKLLAALETNDLSYEPQVRIGKRTVDFLAAIQGKKVIVECEGMLREGSKSFAQATRLFDAETREAVTLLYAWCSHCDDQVDSEQLGHDARPVPQADRHARLERLKQMTRATQC